MALSMDEQRILEEMERRLADDDPLLASRLTSFGRPGLAVLMRSRRARIVLSCLALVVIAAASLAVYALTPFRSERSVQGRSAGPPGVSRSVPARTTGATGSP
jgi:Protein of unknown function (DUF3040)